MNQEIKKATDKLRNLITEVRGLDLGQWGSQAIREETNHMLNALTTIENENLKDNNTLDFTTINCNDEYVKWSFSIEELRERYFSEECDIPYGEDTITEFEFNGVPMCVNTFDDIIDLLGIELSGR